MFTGLVEEVGTVLRLARRGEGAHLFTRCRAVLEGTRIGDSIAVSGACLTVVEMGEGSFAVDCMPETLTHTTLGTLRPGDLVNLERAMALGDRLGGHLVLGHVDAVGEVLAVKTRGISWEVRVSLPPELRGYVAGKGSVAVDGISLTVTDVTEHDFGLGLIPHTLKETTLRTISPGRRVNLEADVLARYVRQALIAGSAPAGETERSRGGRGSSLDESALRTHGFLD
jgi:riboflavin synthase